jgi:hypothetical protein
MFAFETLSSIRNAIIVYQVGYGDFSCKTYIGKTFVLLLLIGGLVNKFVAFSLQSPLLFEFRLFLPL